MSAPIRNSMRKRTPYSPSNQARLPVSLRCRRVRARVTTDTDIEEPASAEDRASSDQVEADGGTVAAAGRAARAPERQWAPWAVSTAGTVRTRILTSQSNDQFVA